MMLTLHIPIHDVMRKLTQLYLFFLNPSILMAGDQNFSYEVCKLWFKIISTRI